MPRTYTTATILLDIFLLVYTLFTLDLAKLQSAKQLASRKFFNFYNILQEGIKVLIDKIDQFNQQYIWQLDIFRGLYPSNNLDDFNGFTNIEDYANQVGEGLDKVNNLIINLIIIDIINFIKIRMAD